MSSTRVRLVHSNWICLPFVQLVKGRPPSVWVRVSRAATTHHSQIRVLTAGWMRSAGTRMQAEAGQPLNRILQRKEAERCAGGGLFFWGIGNPLGDKVAALARRVRQPRVLFSVMRSRPKQIDTAPATVFLWTLAIDPRGLVRPLPEHVIVVSRGCEGPMKKRAHYALVCRSLEPLRLQPHGRLNLAAFRNLGSRNPRVGNSQVTAVLERQATDEANYYDIDMLADLVPPYLVRLGGPVLLSTAERGSLNAIAQHGCCDAAGWTDFVRSLRQNATGRRDDPRLFSCTT